MPTASAQIPLPAPGLRWSNDRTPGIRRLRRGSSFSYIDSKGRVLRDTSQLERIRRLVIPPAWQDVWICPDADGHLQATGRDARGRKQYRYHALWQAGRGETKFANLLQFGSVLPRIRARVERALAGPDEPTRGRVLAALVRLLDTTWMRIGNPEYARSNGSYGLSTLRNKHVGVRGDELMLSFVGKSGVRHEVRLHDRRVARIVRRCRELPGQALFEYVDSEGTVRNVGSTDVNAWLAEAAGCRVTAKDFRTWHGSVLALQLTLAACSADAGQESSQRCRPQDVLAAVARRLGNTPAVCRKAYIHPRVLDLGQAIGDEVARASLQNEPWVKSTVALRGLSAAERQLLALLRKQERKPRSLEQALELSVAAGPRRRPTRVKQALAAQPAG